MTISTPTITNFSGGELSPRLEGRIDLSKYYNGSRRMENFVIHSHGGITRRSGFRFVTEARSADTPVLLIPFEFNSDQTYVLELYEDDAGQGHMRVFTDHGVVLDADGGEYVRDMPYAAHELDRLRFAQTSDVLILVHPNHPVRKLTRMGHDDWSLEAMTFIGQPEAWKEGNYPSAVCFFEQRLVLAGTPNEPATLWLSRTGDMEDFRLKTREVPLERWGEKDIIPETGRTLRQGLEGDTITVHDGGGFEKMDALRGQDGDGNTRYYRYMGDRNFMPTETLSVVFKEAPGDNEIEAVRLADGTLNSDFWDEFQVGDRTEAEAGDMPLSDDAIEATITGRQANAIEFIVPRSKLWIGTAGGEWTVSGTDEVMTPENIKASSEGACGAASARPESVGYATLFIQRSGRKVREMSYSFESDAYVSNDLTILSNHITESGLVQMAYVQEPDSVLYCVKNDGSMVSMTYAPKQDVAAWNRLVTDGKVENVTSVYNGSTGRDELWAVIRRTVNGTERRYIEYLEDEFNGTIQDAFFVDSGLTYDGPATDTVQGLDHLVGRTVDVLADGAVQAPRVVAEDGSIKLDRPASKVQAGLPYRSLVQPVRVEAGGGRGTSQTKKQRITKVAVRFHNTLGGRIGPDPTTMETIHFRAPSTPMGQPTTPFSGDKSVVFPKGWNNDALLTVVQDQPLPMTILLLVPTKIINE